MLLGFYKSLIHFAPRLMPQLRLCLNFRYPTTEVFCKTPKENIVKQN